MSDSDIVAADETLEPVPVDNTWDDYSSQHWVLDALDSLYDMDLFPDDHYNMMYAVLLDYHFGEG